MRHSTMLDAIEDLIGPDILCWNTLFWVKEAESEAFVSWKRSDSSGAWRAKQRAAHNITSDED